MGLLDEAIRDHLELKRRGGADPSAVEREEQEVLAPVDGDSVKGADENGRQQQIAQATLDRPDDLGGDHDVDARLADLSSLGQDTAELDMQAVLEERPPTTDPALAVGRTGEPAAPAYAGAPSRDEQSELGLSRPDAHQSTPEDVPGQERLSFE